MVAGGSRVDTTHFLDSLGIRLGERMPELSSIEPEIEEDELAGETWYTYWFGDHSEVQVTAAEGEVVSLASEVAFIIDGKNIIGMSRAEVAEHLDEEPVVGFEDSGDSWSFASLEWWKGDLVLTENDGFIVDVHLLCP